MLRPSSHRAVSWRGLRPVSLALLLSQPPPSIHSVLPFSFSSRGAPSRPPRSTSPPLSPAPSMLHRRPLSLRGPLHSFTPFYHIPSHRCSLPPSFGLFCVLEGPL
ncbi:hypothetical protein DFH09DRAFT_1188090, partial [Mycena vulgaris]